ncbi:MAG TPA: hypothetical protein VKV04_00025 [Verrucomicrobiae bacterium]|nr:hypothetical protein [Verrucomicrobiae bacterium]
MKARQILLVTSVVLLVVVGIVLARKPSHQQVTIRVTGPLSTNDVAEITVLVLRERAPLLPGNFASPQDTTTMERHLRENVTGYIRSITSRNGRTANVDFGDRLDSTIGYDYDVERETNGWKIIGVGYRSGPTKK